MTSQVGDKDVLLEVPGEADVPLKLFLKHYMGFEYEFLPVVAVAHIGWVIVFFFIFAYGIKFLNFQRRWAMDDTSVVEETLKPHPLPSIKNREEDNKLLPRKKVVLNYINRNSIV